MPGGQGKIRGRSLRVPDEEWKPAQARAAREGETVTDAVRRFLREYGRSDLGSI